MKYTISGESFRLLKEAKAKFLPFAEGCRLETDEKSQTDTKEKDN